MTIVGLEWKGGRLEHPFDIVNVPQKPGIFKLHARLESGDWEIFFIGQAGNLYNTLLAYLGTIAEGDQQATGINQQAKDRIAASEVAYSYAVVPDTKERNGCLRALYDYFQPECNDPKFVPDVTDIGCNPY